MQINYVRISGKSCHKPSNIIRTISISFAVKNVGSDTEMVLLLNPFTAKGGGHQCSWWMEGHPPQGQGEGDPPQAKSSTSKSSPGWSSPWSEVQHLDLATHDLVWRGRWHQQRGTWHKIICSLLPYCEGGLPCLGLHHFQRMCDVESFQLILPHRVALHSKVLKVMGCPCNSKKHWGKICDSVTRFSASFYEILKKQPCLKVYM